MKKILNIMLLFSMIALLLSCGNDSNPSNNVIPKLNILKLVPASGAVKVNSKQMFEIEFDDAVSSGTGNISLFKKSSGLLVEGLDVSSAVTFKDKKITFKFNTLFEYGMEYYILIDSGAVKYKDSYNFEGISSKSDWTFTSAALLDRENTVTADITGAFTKHYVSDPDPYYTRAFATVYYNVVEGRSIYDNEPLYELMIYYPLDYIVNTEFDLATEKWPGLYVGTLSVKTDYYIESGKIKLTVMNDEYVEGEFNFNATADNGQKVYVKNGYFFVKFK